MFGHRTALAALILAAGPTWASAADGHAPFQPGALASTAAPRGPLVGMHPQTAAGVQAASAASRQPPPPVPQEHCVPHGCPVEGQHVHGGNMLCDVCDDPCRKDARPKRKIVRYNYHKCDMRDRPVVPPFSSPTWGYHETCWRVPPPMPVCPPLRGEVFPPVLLEPIDQAGW